VFQTWPWVAGLIAALSTMPAMTQPLNRPSGQSTVDVRALFASTCGFCHGDGGRDAGKGPQLMNTTRSDEFLRDRIKNGKEGAMPAFGQVLSDADIDAIIKYIHELKPESQG
jgi:mono/diheme cytochrome c family protein